MAPYDRAVQSDAEVLDWLRAEYNAPFSGWDFSYIQGRTVDLHALPQPWSYDDLAVQVMRGAASVLDVDTGGGERFASLLEAAGTAVRAYATEGWPPNVPLARNRLTPFGVKVVEVGASPLPFPDQSLDVILNRHGLLQPSEYYRLLVQGGTAITQQVGSETNRELVEALAAKAGVNREFIGLIVERWDAAVAAQLCERAGLEVERVEEYRWTHRFLDAGAIAWYLKAVPWTIEGFSVDGYAAQLLRLHRQIEREGFFDTTFHQFLVVARKPMSGRVPAGDVRPEQ